MTRSILVVEDDAETRAYLAKGLREAGYVVKTAECGRDGLAQALAGDADAMILDRMLPDLDGIAILKSLRAAEVATPVLLLTAVGSTDERVNGLRAGADDYLIKPFAFSELEARLEALLRRPAAAPQEANILQVGDLRLDLISRKATRGERRVDLLPREFAILEYLMRRPNRVVTRTMLLEGVWDYSFDPRTNVVDVHISRLRGKVEQEGAPPLIQTIRGAGYMISDEI